MKMNCALTVLLASVMLCAGLTLNGGEKTSETVKPAVKPQKQPAQKTSDPAVLEGKVVFTKDVGSYTYVQMEKDGKKNWAAGPNIEIKIGDTVKTTQGAFMRNFTSKGLNRTFDSILFTEAFIVNGKMPAAAPKSDSKDGKLLKGPHGQGGGMGMTGKKNAPKVEPPAAGSVKAADGGLTVEQVYAQRKELSGKKVTVRGKVMRRSSLIMNLYWYHIQDGTGKAPANDLTVTSLNGKVEVGSVITAHGILTADKDLGSGYKYSALLEKAELLSE